MPCIVITEDVKDFAAFERSRYEGVFYPGSQCAPTHEIVDAVFEIVDQYGSPTHMNGKTENLDKWLPTHSYIRGIRCPTSLDFHAVPLWDRHHFTHPKQR